MRCFFINERWWNNHTVKRILCTPDIELLSISCRPFYLPREFCTIFAVLVDVPPSTNYTVAAETITKHMNEFVNLSPSAPKLLLSDVSGCSLRTYLPTCKHYVTCATRGKKTINLCYCNMKNAYKSPSKPPLGTSDHNIIQLLPIYKSVLKTGKLLQKTVTVWNDDGIAKLRGCSGCTIWDTFYDSYSSLSDLVDTVTDYMDFCVDTILPK